MQQFLRLALPLGNRASRAIDVGARAIVVALEKDYTRPDIDGLFVISGEVVIESGERSSSMRVARSRSSDGAGVRAESVRSGSVIRRPGV